MPRFEVQIIALVAFPFLACTATQTPVPRAETSASALDGAWHLEALPPEPATQLTQRCYGHLGLVHYSDPQLSFSGDRVHVRAQSIGNLLTWSDDWFQFTREGDQVHVDTRQWRQPWSALIPCGAIPESITISPGGERLLVNVAHCPPCANEAAIDGIVGLTFVRTE